MSTPFEDLEYLADYLPEEGEAVIVARRDGELVCEPYSATSSETTLDPELYGRLVHANVRLAAVGTTPLGVSVIAAFALCVAIHQIFQLGWNWWYVDVGIILLTLLCGARWIEERQKRLFLRRIQPVLAAQLRQRGMQKYVLIGILRQRPELRRLLDAIACWSEF